jgi:hypothetical protein
MARHVTDQDSLSAAQRSAARLLTGRRAGSRYSVRVRMRTDDARTALTQLRHVHHAVVEATSYAGANPKLRESYRLLLTSNLGMLRASRGSLLADYLSALTAVASDGLDGILSLFITGIYRCAEEQEGYRELHDAFATWRRARTPLCSDGLLGAVIVATRHRLVVCDFDSPGLSPPPQDMGGLRRWINQARVEAPDHGR